jgi:hypothetical protein
VPLSHLLVTGYTVYNYFFVETEASEETWVPGEEDASPSSILRCGNPTSHVDVLLARKERQGGLLDATFSLPVHCSLE